MHYQHAKQRGNEFINPISTQPIPQNQRQRIRSFHLTEITGSSVDQCPTDLDAEDDKQSEIQTVEALLQHPTIPSVFGSKQEVCNDAAWVWLRRKTATKMTINLIM